MKRPTPILPNLSSIALSLALVAIISLTGTDGQQAQRVTLFLQPFCQGVGTVIEGTTDYVVPGSTTYPSYNLNGLWRVQPCTNPTCTGAAPVFPQLAQFPTCSVDAISSSHIKFTMYGDSQQTARQITFYAEAMLVGESVTITADSPDVGFTSGSYFIPGVDSWEVYSGPGYTGTASCLEPDASMVVRGYGITYRNDDKVVGSVRLGCNNGTPGPTQSTTAGTTTTSTTTTTTTTTNTPPTSTTPGTTTTAGPTTTRPPGDEQRQRVLLQSAANCGGSGTLFEDSTEFTVPVGTEYPSYNVHGLWRVQPCDNPTCNGATPVPLRVAPDPVCYPVRIFSTHIKFTMYGDSYQTAREIKFYSVTALEGESVSVRGDEPNLNNFAYRSYFFTGTDSWAIFSGPGYTGEARCVEPEPIVVGRNYGITYRNEAQVVGSVKLGCADVTPDPNPTTTTTTTTNQPPSSTTTTSTTPPTGPTTTRPPGNGNCTEGGTYFVPYPGDCSKYMTCRNGDLLPDVQTCPAGTLFDPEYRQCNREELVLCAPTCPPTGSVTFPHFRNCSLYWLCVSGESTLMQCPPRMLYDYLTTTCNLEEAVFCPNLCPPQGSGARFPHAHDCSLYWECTNGNPALNQCPSNQLFDPVSGQCRAAGDVDCDDDSTIVNSKSIFSAFIKSGAAGKFYNDVELADYDNTNEQFEDEDFFGNEDLE